MDIVTTFLDTATVVRPVLTARAVSAAWDRPSALPGMTVGGLTAHLARAVLTVDGYLDAPEPPVDAPLFDAAGYVTGAVPDTSAESEVNRQVLQRAEAGAHDGPGAVEGAFTDALARLDERLRSARPERRLTVLGGHAIRLDDYLATRITELVVHVDDLVASVDGLDRSQLPDAAGAIAVGLLAEVARRRCSTGDLVAALARRERAPARAPYAF